MAEVVAWRYRHRGTTEDWEYTANIFHVEHLQRQARLVQVEGCMESVPAWEVESLVRADTDSIARVPAKAWGGC